MGSAVGRTPGGGLVSMAAIHTPLSLQAVGICLVLILYHILFEKPAVENGLLCKAEHLTRLYRQRRRTKRSGQLLTYERVYDTASAASC